MPIEIIKERTWEHIEDYQLSFSRKDGSGYMFDCDAYGNLKEPDKAEAVEQLEKDPVFKKRIIDFSKDFPTPAVGRCDCGAKVTLAAFTNTCHKCGADYNQSGQRLAPRSQWGEETGEAWYECY